MILLQRKPKLGHTKPATEPHAGRGLDLAALDQSNQADSPKWQNNSSSAFSCKGKVDTVLSNFLKF